jgi:hypothetical protein
VQRPCARSAEVKETFQGFREESSGGRVPLCAQRYCKECRVEETFQGFQGFRKSFESSGGKHFRMQAGVQGSRLRRRKQRPRPLELGKSSKGKGRNTCSERSYNYRQIWVHGPIAIGSRRSCTRFNPCMQRRGAARSFRHFRFGGILGIPMTRDWGTSQ